MEYKKKNEQAAPARQAGQQPQQAATTGDPYAGRPLHLPAGLKQRIRTGFGIDADALSVTESPDAAGAGAIAQGDAIRFEPGAFRPNTTAGLEMLGHELEHVRQQAEGRVQADAPANTSEDPTLERAGDAAGRAFAGGTLANAAPVPVAAGSAHGAVAQGFSFKRWRRKKKARKYYKRHEANVGASNLSGGGAVRNRQKLIKQLSKLSGSMSDHDRNNRYTNQFNNLRRYLLGNLDNFAPNGPEQGIMEQDEKVPTMRTLSKKELASGSYDSGDSLYDDDIEDSMEDDDESEELI